MGVYANKLLERLAAGNVLHCGNDETEEGGVVYWTEPNGKRARRDTVKELVSRSLVVPVRDGLFEADTQSWRLP